METLKEEKEMSNKKYKNLQQTMPPIDEPVIESNESIVDEEPAEVVEPDPVVIGVVTDCLKLNIRKEPNKNSDPVCVIDALSELVIDLKASTFNWFKVETKDGVEGFCMKKFVAVR